MGVGWTTGFLMETPRRLFYRLALLLMWIGVASAFVQKRYESGCAMSMARRTAAGLEETSESKSEVECLIWKGHCWQVVGVAAVLLALLSHGVATFRREKLRGIWVVMPLSFFVLLELIMV